MALEYLTVEHLRLKRIIKIFSKILIDPTVAWNGTPCWIWTGTKDPKYGYGTIGFKNKTVRIHRLFYAWAVAPIPSYEETDLTIDHLCNRKSCCNPVHLELVSHSENNFRARKKLCSEGHEISGSNSYVTPSRPNRGHQCLICKKATLRKIYHRKMQDPEFRASELARGRERYLRLGR